MRIDRLLVTWFTSAPINFFYLAGFIWLLMALWVPLVLLYGGSEASRWLFNQVTFSCWHLTFVPPMLALFTQITQCRLRRLLNDDIPAFVLIAIFVGAVGFIAVAVVNDATNGTFDPYSLSGLIQGPEAGNSNDVYPYEKALREAKQEVDKARSDFNREKERSKDGKDEELRKALEALREQEKKHAEKGSDYVKYVHGKREKRLFSWWWQHSNAVGKYNTFLTFIIVGMCSLYAAFFILEAMVILLARFLWRFLNGLNVPNIERMWPWLFIDALGIACFIPWLPLRVHADWYANSMLFAEEAPLPLNIPRTITSVVVAFVVILIVLLFFIPGLLKTIRNPDAKLIEKATSIGKLVLSFLMVLVGWLGVSQTSLQIQLSKGFSDIVATNEGRALVILIYAIIALCAWAVCATAAEWAKNNCDEQLYDY